MVRKPEILLLDEATSSIDKESEDVIKSLKELSKSTTILIIAHKSNLIEASNYVYLIQNKKINEEGTVENLINNKNSEFNSLYSKIFMNRTFIIAEIGVNHNNNMALAKKMISAAKKAGADAVKFQTFNTEEFVTRKTPKVKYQKNILIQNPHISI